MSTRRALILPVYIPTLILSFSQGLLIPTLPIFAKQFVSSYGMIGLILAAEGIGRLIGDIPAGLLLRKIGRNRTIIIGILLVIVSVGLLYGVTSTIQIVILRLLSGMGNATWNVSRHSYLVGATASHERGRAICIFGGVNRIGGLAGPATGGLVAAAFGLRIPFLVYTVLAGSACVVAAFSLEKERPLPEGHRVTGFFDTLKTHWRVLASAGGGQLCAQAIRAGRNVIIPLYGADVIGLDIKDVGLILSISSFVDMLMFYPAGIIMDRWGRKFAIIPCFLIQAVGMSLIPSSSGFWTLLVATSLIGFGNGIGSGSMMTLGADLAPRESVGEFLGLWRLIGDGGHMGSPLIVGAISDLAGMTPAIYVITLLGLASSGIFAVLVPETLDRSQNK